MLDQIGWWLADGFLDMEVESKCHTTPILAVLLDMIITFRSGDCVIHHLISSKIYKTKYEVLG